MSLAEQPSGHNGLGGLVRIAVVDLYSSPRWHRVSGRLLQQLSLTFELFPLLIFLLHFLTILF